MTVLYLKLLFSVLNFKLLLEAAYTYELFDASHTVT